MDRGKPEYGKQYALTGAPGTKCIMNGDTWAASEVRPDAKDVPEAVRNSQFGCRNCLWMCVECKQGSKYRPANYKGKPTCETYTYYD